MPTLWYNASELILVFDYLALFGKLSKKQYQLSSCLHSQANPPPFDSTERRATTVARLRAAVAMTARVAPPWPCHRGGDGLCGGRSRQGVLALVPSA